MAKANVWHSMDELTTLWEELQSKLTGPPIVDDNKQLNFSGGKILYKGRPIGECKIHERIEASALVADLIDRRKEILKINEHLIDKAKRLLEDSISRLEDA